MVAQAPDKRPHFILQSTATALRYKAHQSGRGQAPALPALARQQHGRALLRQLDELKPIEREAVRIQQQLGLESGLGLQIEFVGQPQVELAFQSLANEAKHIELLSVRREGDTTYANVFVPDGKLGHFEQYIADYLEEKKGSKGQSLDHKPLLNTIASIRAAQLRALWTDDPQLLPQDGAEPFWWEVWLPVRGHRQAVVEDFKKLARLAGCEVNDTQFNFPERTVVLMYASPQQFTQSAMVLNCVAELRRAKDTAEFFDQMGVEEQRSWVDDLLAHAAFASPGDDVPHVCVLDSGVNRGHPLLAPLLDAADVHTVDPAWGVDDQADHGTGLASLAAFGDLTETLGAPQPLAVRHRLESVKLTPGRGANAGDARHHAALFADAVSHPEITAAARRRIFMSAVSASDYRDRGRPSSWSAAVDALAADVDDSGAATRLFILSAGNTTEHDAWMAYPDSLTTNLVHDPGQAWNAITVGAFTNKVNTETLHVAPVAAEGGLSPYTTTSATWDSAWPLKPDVVCEGGNV